MYKRYALIWLLTLIIGLTSWVEEIQIGDNFIKASTTPFLELYLDNDNSQIAVRDLRSGILWRSNPSFSSDDEKAIPMWKYYLRGIPIILHLMIVRISLVSAIFRSK